MTRNLLGDAEREKDSIKVQKGKHKWEIKKFLNLNFPESIVRSCFVSIVVGLFCFGWSCFTRVSHRNL